jgi:hypothetical protein
MLGLPIAFEVRERADLNAVEVVPRIDGMLLTELVGDFEAGAGLVAVDGPYGGLVPSRNRFGAMHRHFRGGTTESYGPATPVLGCDCGEWAHWALLCRIDVTDRAVTWAGFAQPRYPSRDYSGFGPFRFDRDDYEDALAELALAMA